jgi:hypothetical protein
LSKLGDTLSNLGHAAPLKLGFGQIQERTRNPVILIVGVADSPARLGPAVAQADVVLLRSRKGGKPATVKPDTKGLWGAALSDCTPEDLDALKESGCDFILVESESAPGITLRDDGLARGFVLPGQVSDARAHAIEDLPFDFLLVRDAAPEWPLTMGQILALQEKVSLFSKHMFLEVTEPPAEEDLELLRDMPISGLVFDLATQDAAKLETLKTAIAGLEPRKPRGEHVAVLPASMQANSASRHTHEPEPDHEDDDDEE